MVRKLPVHVMVAYFGLCMVPPLPQPCQGVFFWRVGGARPPPHSLAVTTLADEYSTQVRVAKFRRPDGVVVAPTWRAVQGCARGRCTWDKAVACRPRFPVFSRLFPRLS